MNIHWVPGSGLLPLLVVESITGSGKDMGGVKVLVNRTRGYPVSISVYRPRAQGLWVQDPILPGAGRRSPDHYVYYFTREDAA